MAENDVVDVLGPTREGQASLERRGVEAVPEDIWHRRVHRTATAQRSRTLRDIVEDHRSILEVIERGDPERAAAEMERHIRSTARLVVAQELDGPA